MSFVEFPAMRREVMVALACLADADHQVRVWLNGAMPSPSYHDDLAMNIHVLYDDSQVLPFPATRVGTVLVAGDEVIRLEELGRLLDVLIAEHGDRSDRMYAADPRWSAVSDAAAGCLAAMVRSWGFR